MYIVTKGDVHVDATDEVLIIIPPNIHKNVMSKKNILVFMFPLKIMQ